MAGEISIKRGDSDDVTVTFEDASGNSIDLTGATVFFTVKPIVDDDATDSAAIISKTVTAHLDAENGQTQFTLTTTDTTQTIRNYLYDFQLKDSLGEISTWGPAIFRVTDDITRRTS